MPRPHAFLRLIAAVLLGACTARIPYPLGIPGRSGVAIAVSPTTFSAPVRHPSDIGDAGKTGLAEDLKAVRQRVDAYVAAWLRRRPGVQVIGDATAPPPTLAQAKRQGADLLLAVDVAGYGQIKRRWVAALFGSGVVEGIGQGVLAAHATGNPMIGLGVGAEEITSEGLTWIGGSWFWGRYFAPVTLEGSLWRVGDGRLVWRDVAFADNSDEIWSWLTGKGLPGKRQALATGLAHAEGDLFGDLGRYLHKEVLIHRHGNGARLALGAGSPHASP